MEWGIPYNGILVFHLSIILKLKVISHNIEWNIGIPSILSMLMEFFQFPTIKKRFFWYSLLWNVKDELVLNNKLMKNELIIIY